MDGVSQEAGLGEPAPGGSQPAWLSQSLTETRDLCILTLPLEKEMWRLKFTDPKQPKTIRYFVQVND